MILKSYDRSVDKCLDLRILHSVEEQAYGARGKADNIYWLQLKTPEGPIICCYSGGEDHYVRYYLFIEVS